MGRLTAPRPLWITIVVNAALIAVAALDGWAAVFWAEVGGSLGMPIAAAAGCVILVLAALLVTDVRRQILLRSPSDEAAGAP